MNTSNTQATHTPGPWTAVANRPDEDGGKLDRVRSADGHLVAGIPAYEHDQAEEDANARLIAAAPELLAALEGLLAQYRLTRPQIFGTDGHEQTALAAIAKAKAQIHA